MDISTSIGGCSGYAPAAGDAPSAAALNVIGDRQVGEVNHTEPVARRPIGSSCGDDASDDSTIAGLERQVAAQRREIQELRHQPCADRDVEDPDRWHELGCGDGDHRSVPPHRYEPDGHSNQAKPVRPF
jgi:hypothetical protein